MKQSRLKISGIYDPRTIEFLLKEQIELFSFDFLPLSSNFLPGHSFEGILKKYFSRDQTYFLYFGKEPNFVIQKTLDDIAATVGYKLSDLSNIFIQFTDEVSIDYAESFSFPYFLNVKSAIDFNLLQNSHNLRGLSFSYNDLMSLGDHNQIFKKLEEIFNWAHERNIKVEVRVDWGTSFSSSILDFFEFDFFNFSISPKVEVCYRNVNLNVIGKEVKLIKELVL